MGKYSFSTTTVGDLLDNPEAFELFKELVRTRGVNALKP